MITIKQDQFQKLFQTLCNEKKKCVMLFTADVDQNGETWCPYCAKTLPSYPEIEKQAKKANLEIYKCLVGTKQEWKDPEHKYKTNPLLKVKTVPTMGVFDGQKLTTTLDSSQIIQKIQRDLMFQFVNK